MHFRMWPLSCFNVGPVYLTMSTSSTILAHNVHIQTYPVLIRDIVIRRSRGEYLTFSVTFYSTKVILHVKKCLHVKPVYMSSSVTEGYDWRSSICRDFRAPSRASSLGTEAVCDRFMYIHPTHMTCTYNHYYQPPRVQRWYETVSTLLLLTCEHVTPSLYPVLVAGPVFDKHLWFNFLNYFIPNLFSILYQTYFQFWIIYLPNLFSILNIFNIKMFNSTP